MDKITVELREEQVQKILNIIEDYVETSCNYVPDDVGIILDKLSRAIDKRQPMTKKIYIVRDDPKYDIVTMFVKIDYKVLEGQYSQFNTLAEAKVELTKRLNADINTLKQYLTDIELCTETCLGSIWNNTKAI